MKQPASRAPLPALPFVVLVMTGASSACTSLDDPEDVYQDDNTLEIGQELPDERPSGPIDEAQPSAGDPWSCVESRRAIAPVPEERPETVTYSVPIVDWVTQETPPGLTIRVCNRIDPLCVEPLAVLTPEPARFINFPVPARFEVYLRLETPEHLPATYYFDGPVTESRVGGLIQMLRFPTAAGLAQQYLGTELNPMMGVLALRSYDCNGAIVAGAVFELDPNMGVPYTLINNAPTRSIIPTDASGIAGFANLPQGGFLVRGFVADDTREFGLANFTIQPAVLNIVEVRPTN